MKINIALVFLILITPVAASADDTRQGQILLHTGNILHGQFVEEKQVQGFNSPLISKGNFTVAPDHGVIWNTEKPFVTTTVITPAGLAQNAGGKIIMNLKAQKIPFMSHLYDMLGGVLAGNWQALETDFIVSKSRKNQGWQVTMTPIRTDNPAMPFSSITAQGHHFVENVVLLKSDGDTDTLTFTHQALSSKQLSAAENSAFNSVNP